MNYIPFPGSTMLNQDYRDMLSLFLENKVEFILVGAYAMAAHGFVRATGDIDFFVKPDAENAQKALAAIQQFGAPLHEVNADDFSKEGMVFQIGVAPRRIDILTNIDGLSFDEAWKERVEIEIDGLTIPIISLLGLIKNKRATGREKDLLDAVELEKRL